MYKLSEFGLNKQSLKRKLKEVTKPDINLALKTILDDRTTSYSLETIEYLIEGFYSGKGVLDTDEKSTQPLSVYYAKKNKGKYETFKSLISIKKTGSIDKSLEKDVKSIVVKSHEELIDYIEFNNKLNEVADKYGVILTEVLKIANTVEDEWITTFEE